MAAGMKNKKGRPISYPHRSVIDAETRTHVTEFGGWWRPMRTIGVYSYAKITPAHAGGKSQCAHLG